MRKLFVIPLVAIGLAVAGPAYGGQPNASCEDPGASPPPGFDNSAGFAHAQTVYAGSPGTPSLANGNGHAVSQYDIACFGGPKH